MTDHLTEFESATKRTQTQRRKNDSDDLGGEQAVAAPPLSQNQTSSYQGPERRSEIADSIDLDSIDYFPMFWASIKAVTLTIIGQFIFPMIISLQLGLNLELRLWARFIPYFAMRTDAATFSSIIFWSAIGTSVILAGYSVISFRPRVRLRERMGRLFAWLDITLMAGILWYRHHILNVVADQQTWMLVLGGIGIVGFVIGTKVVHWQYQDRVEAANEAI